jgi:hypothetical protein
VEDLPERWSAQRKTELVLRLLRGEPLDAVSRKSQVPAHELESRKRVFLETGARGLKSRSDPEERISYRNLVQPVKFDPTDKASAQRLGSWNA